MLTGAVVAHLCLLGIEIYAGVEADFLGIVAYARRGCVLKVFVGSILRVVQVANIIQQVVSCGQRSDGIAVGGAEAGEFSFQSGVFSEEVCMFLAESVGGKFVEIVARAV